jgi:hypothetical protein
MKPTDLLNQRVRIEISDPWDFGTECGTAPRKGVLFSLSDLRAVVELDETVVYQGLALQSVVVTSRHANRQLELSRDRSFPANLVFVAAKAS